MTSEAENLVGIWRLISCEEREVGGGVNYPLGRMSAQLMRSNQAQFGSEDPRQATTEEKVAAWSNYFGYFGTYTIDAKAATVVHHIEGSWFPNLIGTDHGRKACVGRRHCMGASTKCLGKNKG
jgi:hypothetical protein